MPSTRRQKPKGKASPKAPTRSSRPTPKRPRSSHRPAARPSAAKPVVKTVPKAAAPSPARSAAKPKEPQPELEVPLPDGRKHVLSLSFVRDGDEFLARLETDVGHITELKNRSLDQLLTLVASELEDLLE